MSSREGRIPRASSEARNAITSLGENNLQRKDIDRLHVPTDSSKRDVEYTAPEELSEHC